MSIRDRWAERFGRPRARENAERAAPAALPETDGAVDVPTVPYVPVLCPFCGDGKPITDGIYKPLKRRYHICQSCDGKFHSVEIDPREIGRRE